MKVMLSPLRFALIILLLCLSNLSAAMQLKLDEQANDASDSIGSISIQFHETELDDQDSDGHLVGAYSNHFIKPGSCRVPVKHQLQVFHAAQQSIRAPPSKH
jgi:hypothetical protein